jgi:hypothetical protein
LALVRLIKGLGDIQSKFFFFIDGLDEYEGFEHSIIRTVLNLTKPSNVKLCLSSQPPPPVQEKFGKDNQWKLEVHESLEGDEDFKAICW